MPEHDCPWVGEPDPHRPITDPSDIALLNELICPLCLHDMWFIDGCIECGHWFMFVEANVVIVGGLPE